MTTDHEPRTPDTPRWLHRWAVLTVCATLGLLTLGAVVTTFGVGMADPIWPTYPWHLLLIDWTEPKPGFLVEHSHRLAGYVVGCCVIVLALGLWLAQPRRWRGVLGTVALGAVIVQGLLGGFRVLLDELLGQQFSLIHGFFAQIVFALLVSLAVYTSRGWSAEAAESSPRLRRWSLLTAGVILLQILLGGFVRHTYSPLGQRGHLLVAFAVVAAVVWLVKLAAEERSRTVRGSVWILTALVALQVLLGVEAWLTRFLGTSRLEVQAFVRTAHFLVGASVFAASVVTCLHAHRQTARAVRLVPAPLDRLEGAA